jgi:hypothetical protein
MHPHNVLATRIVIYDVRTFDDAVWAEIARGLEREEFIDESPLHEISRGITVDGLEGTAVELVLADPVVDGIYFDDPAAVGLDMLV